MKPVDVGATVGADGVEIKLPRLRVVVERRQAERLRDALNAADRAEQAAQGIEDREPIADGDARYYQPSPLCEAEARAAERCQRENATRLAMPHREWERLRDYREHRRDW